MWGGVAVNIIRYDRATDRVFIRCSGYWTLTEAEEFREKIRAVCWAAEMSGRSMSILWNMIDYVPQGAEIRMVNMQTFALLGGAAIDRFALVVPSALARSQMRRQISRLDCQFFTEREPAIQWLGWTERMPIDCPA
jgi:hypothetical protein